MSNDHDGSSTEAGKASPVNDDAKPHNPGLNSPSTTGSDAPGGHGGKDPEAGESGGLPSDVEPDPSQQPG